jgi:hypothetical protein
MGVFSWDCKYCGHPMLMLEATNVKNRWMNRVVVLTKRGSMYRGLYDGYGRVDGAEIDSTDEPECYHENCWDIAGRPTKYSEPSKSSADQGFFFGNGAHDIDPPSIDPDKCITYSLKEIVDKLTNYLEVFGDMPVAVSGYDGDWESIQYGTLVTDLSVLAPEGKRICVIDADGTVESLME